MLVATTGQTTYREVIKLQKKKKKKFKAYLHSNQGPPH